MKRPQVTRLEIEFRSELTKFETLKDMFDNERLFGIAMLYMSSYTSLFSKIEFKKIRLKRLIKKVDIDQLRIDEALRDRYINTFIGYAKKIQEIRLSPFRILLERLDLDEQTRKDILACARYIDIDIDEYKEKIEERVSFDPVFDSIFDKMQDDEKDGS